MSSYFLPCKAPALLANPFSNFLCTLDSFVLTNQSLSLPLFLLLDSSQPRSHNNLGMHPNLRVILTYPSPTIRSGIAFRTSLHRIELWPLVHAGGVECSMRSRASISRRKQKEGPGMQRISYFRLFQKR